MKFVIFGTGGVGGYFGGRLALAGSPVWFVARGEHLAAMKRNGLRVITPERSFTIPAGRMTDAVESIGPADVVLVCVKSYDTEDAAHQLAPILTSDTIVISLQNGIDNEQKIQRAIPAGRVFGGVANIYATITAPGEITQSGGPNKIAIGPLQPPTQTEEARVREALNAMTHAGVDAEWTADIVSALWKKFIFISPVSGLTALTRLTLGELLAVPATRHLLNDAMQEAYSLASTLRVNVEPGYVSDTMTKLQQYSNDTRSSLYNDLIRERPLELEALAGTVVRLGEAMNISTPIHRAIYAALLPYALKFAAQRERRQAT